jgi:thioredoxin 1
MKVYGMADGRSVVIRNTPGDSGREGGRTVTEHMLTLTDQTFDEEVKSAVQPVLVDFWAEWCGPCKMIAPILHEIAAENAGRLLVGKINIDDNLEVTQRFDVMSIPTLILFKDGEPKLRIVGAKGKGQLLQELHQFL